MSVNPEFAARLEARFRAVIASRGYSGPAIDGIIEEWLPKYLKDIPGFLQMLDKYEKGEL